VPTHIADLGTDSFEQQFTLGLLENNEQTLEEVAAALERIEQGSFGRCEECQKTIPHARLEALPYARYCIACARKLQGGDKEG
jgi:RNA polymerase-binding transcription factor DksA